MADNRPDRTFELEGLGSHETAGFDGVGDACQLRRSVGSAERNGAGRRPATALQAYVLVTVAVIAVCARCCETAAAAPMALVCYSKLPGTSGMQLFQIRKTGTNYSSWTGQAYLRV